MEFQRTPLDARSAGFIDCAMDCGEIGTDVGTALVLYGDRAEIAALIHPDRRGAGATGRRNLAGELSVMGAELMLDLSRERQMGLLMLGIVGSLRSAYRLAEVCSSWAFTDETRGGDLIPFRRLVREDRYGRPTKGLARKLHSPGFIARYVRQSEDVRFLRDDAVFLVNRLPQPLEPMDDAVGLIMSELAEQHGVIRTARLEAERRGPAYRIVRQRRKVAKRAAVMAAAMLGASTVGAFARGEPIVLPGQELALRVTSAGSMTAMGPGQLAVDLLDAGGVELASLCVYVDQTPALDQITALALHMQAGCEADVVRRANIIRATAAGAQHPALARRVGPPAGLTVEDIAPSLWNVPRPHFDQQRERRREYWQATRHLWIRELSVVVFGRLGRVMADIVCTSEHAFAAGFDMPERIAGGFVHG